MTTCILIVAMLALCGLCHSYKVERDRAIAEFETLRDSAIYLATLIATLERRKRAMEEMHCN